MTGRWGCAVQEVDAYWLQRRIAQAYGEIDAAAAQALAEEVLERLQARPPYSLVGLVNRVGCVWLCISQARAEEVVQQLAGMVMRLQVPHHSGLWGW